MNERADSPQVRAFEPPAIGVANELALFRGDAIVVGVFEGPELSPAAQTLDGTLGGLLRTVLTIGDMSGERLTRALVYTHGRIPCPRVLLVGMGKREDTDAECLRRVAGECARHVRDLGASHVGVAIHSGVAAVDAVSAGSAIAEGVLLGLYEFPRHRTPEEGKPLRRVAATTLLDAEARVRRALEEGARAGELTAGGAVVARDLSNEPPNFLPPAALAERARALAEEVGLGCTVYSGDDLRERGFAALLAVGQGSANGPAFIQLEHRPDDDGRPLVFVGKGICFDSGGLSLKTSSGMMDMKHDMSGAAAVVGAMYALARLDVPRRVVGLIAAAENMPGATAQRPGDVIRARNGTTIEVLNTDAEGRLVLADALVYAGEFAPAAVVDLATLTGAIVTALGTRGCGLFGRDDAETSALVQRVRRSAEATHEQVWPMPLWEGCDDDIKSDVADVKNIGEGTAGAIAGAAFLSRFARGYPWAHLDIAGTMTANKTSGYTVKGATGFGARLLVHLAQHWDE
jgi:leucyl aminopeptidase